MRRSLVFSLLLMFAARPAFAQNPVPSLSVIFQDLFGPKGLVVDSNAVLPDGSTHSAHFNGDFQSNFTQFNIALASQLTSLPLPTPASGFTYRFDASTGTFVRSTQSFGPILSDRAETIGKGRFSFGYTYQFFSFDSLEGIDLSRVPALFRHDDFQLGGGRTDVVTTSNAIDASVGQWTGAVTYGLTDRLDVSAAVPVVHTSIHVLSAATIQRVGTAQSPETHFFRDPDAPGGIGNEKVFQSGGSASGIGDVILRAKGTLVREARHGLAVGLDMRVPTGDERNLLGAGALGLRPFMAYSATFQRISPHVNLAYYWNGKSVLAGDPATGRKADVPDQIGYVFGADIGVHERFSVTADWLGRYVIDSPRVRLTSVKIVGPNATEQLPDITFDRGSFDASSVAVGFKTNVAGRLLVDFNLRFTVEQNGLTDRVTPLIGFEYGF